jgi:NAD(P)-dependent dehydrogenase (short-subunit alcohol dehydrogenase family)
MADRAARVVVITGATGKLGPTVARRFAEDGSRLALVARSEDEVAELIDSLPGGRGRHAGFSMDLDDADATVAGAEAVRSRLGAPSALLHLVGGYIGGTSFGDTPLEVWRQLFDLNVMTTVHALRAFLPDIRAAEHGRIVTVSTPLANAPVIEVSAYTATKASVESLTLSVAKELAGTTATANVILVRTINDQKPTHTRPAEIAEALAWLCSPAAGPVNGQRIPLVGRA